MIICTGSLIFLKFKPTRAYFARFVYSNYVRTSDTSGTKESIGGQPIQNMASGLTSAANVA